MQDASGFYDDPGWSGAARALRGAGDGVATLRIVFLALAVAPLLILVVLTFLLRDAGEAPVAPVAGVATLQLAAAAAAAAIVRRPLDPASAQRAVDAYRSRFFLAFAVDESPLLLGFVLTFVVGEQMWTYLVPLPIFFAGMAAIAPGPNNLAAIEQDLMRRGARYSFRAELATRAPSRPGRT